MVDCWCQYKHIFIYFHVSHSEKMDPIDFRTQRSKVKVIIDMYKNKLVNTKETKPLCASPSNLADMLSMMRE